MQHIEQACQQLGVQKILHHFQIHLNTREHRVFLHSIQVQHRLHQNKCQQLCNLQNIHKILHYHYNILLAALKLQLDHHIYQTYHLCLTQERPHFQQNLRRNLLHQYTLDHQDKAHNQQVPNHFQELPHHIREKMYKQMQHFQNHTPVNLDYLNNNHHHYQKIELLFLLARFLHTHLD